jgi:hypothetical protein
MVAAGAILVGGTGGGVARRQAERVIKKVNMKTAVSAVNTKDGRANCSDFVIHPIINSPN